MALHRIAVILCTPALVWGLQLLPPTLKTSSNLAGAVWQVSSSSKIIYIENKFASKVDTDGLTLIPPSSYDFASLFQEDISQLTGVNWTLQRVNRLPDSANVSGILLGSFSGNTSITYENGNPTSEGYELDISPIGAFIGGTGARGMWWGTRTLLQLLLSQNGTLTSHCVARGVTVIPEIEAPGHCLYLTKWKPELSLAKRDLLNLSHPEAIPTVKRIWSEFLPWFETKEVHVGADEYDSTLADVYIGFVNEMSDFINSTSGKRIRIWGTDEPSENVTISKDVVIQHWQYGQSDPVLLANTGYDIVNSEDWWAYMSLKNDHMPILPARYPQFFNESRVLNFADEPKWQWTPADFNPFNKTMQVPAGSHSNRGAILAAWNDNGPDASTQLEAYYAMRRGIALTGARAWSGSRGPALVADDVAPSIDFFSPLAPGQNLDRIVPSTSPLAPLVTWTRSAEDSGTVRLGHGSKGMNYTLMLSVTGPFTLTGPDNTLSLDDNGSLVFTADGWTYPLRTVTLGGYGQTFRLRHTKR
ncbi:glycoside hydrolase [Colletotrichum tofieldiae]|nr:glycoside hydrolase [Colletotrichum tofieldiae]GKT76794.1 glycoside hydrolase [Colletotrichum tofieldiae]